MNTIVKEWTTFMELNKKIKRFINRFTHGGKLKEVECIFSYSGCYWFARILYDRFYMLELETDGDILYDPILNHFACRINDRIYDITGDITDSSIYGWRSWSEYAEIDELETERIIKYCIRMEDE